MPGYQDTGGVFKLHRLALAPAQSSVLAERLQAALDAAVCDGDEAFQHFIIHNGLAPLWFQALQASGLQTENALALHNALQEQYFASVAMYLAQSAALKELDGLFESQTIPYVVMKGGLARELVYNDPTLRPATDLDILIHPAQRELATKVLLEAGFTFHPDPENISHEATFSRAGVDIDLHWDILRPGRTRIELAPVFLLNRQRYRGFWGLDETHAAFMMLVHPAFAKYVCSPNMSLVRVVDFIHWTHLRHIDWAALVNLLADAGLKTAAWMQLHWFLMLQGKDGLDAPDTFLRAIQPGPVRSRYLNYWLEHDLPTRYLHKPLWIQLGLTLFLHDRVPDAWRAIAMWKRAKTASRHDQLIQTYG